MAQSGGFQSTAQISGALSPSHFASATWTVFLFLECANLRPPLGPLHTLFPLPGIFILYLFT